MHRTVRVLLLSATLLLIGGWFLYHHGSQVNHESGIADQTLWEQAPGDKWLYIGGLMMLISGSLGAAAVLVWSGGKEGGVESTLIGPVDR